MTNERVFHIALNDAQCEYIARLLRADAEANPVTDEEYQDLGPRTYLAKMFTDITVEGEEYAADGVTKMLHGFCL